MIHKDAERLPPITMATLPKTIEQRTLECLERIEKLLSEHWAADRPTLRADGTYADLPEIITNVKPTETPFIRQQGKVKGKSK